MTFFSHKNTKHISLIISVEWLKKTFVFLYRKWFRLKRGFFSNTNIKINFQSHWQTKNIEGIFPVVYFLFSNISVFYDLSVPWTAAICRPQVIQIMNYLCELYVMFKMLKTDFSMENCLTSENNSLKKPQKFHKIHLSMYKEFISLI